MLTAFACRILATLAPPSPAAPLPYLSTMDVAKRLNARFGVVTGVLYDLKSAGRVVKTASGEWRLKERPARLSDEQRRLLNAVKAAKSDVLPSKLAANAGILRRSLRKGLDELVAAGALVERADGWYEALI